MKIEKEFQIHLDDKKDMELVREFPLLQSEATFADESFRQGDWFKPVNLSGR